ncbi:MAG: DUF3198 domain-containing protein [Thermoplasmata archaeon]|nr:DUF3198 domain-containing protein [Thermoplasmata archaeon]
MARFLREYALELSSIILMIGMIMTLFVVLEYGFGDVLPVYLENILNDIGDWIVWMVVVGPILLMGGGWYFFDGIKKRKEFNDLMDTDSKAVFVRNYDRLEEIAYYLTESHRQKFYDKRDEFKIK